MTEDATRRDVFRAAATGLAAAAAPAFAQRTMPVTDPQTKYTSEPFPEQKQKWPALQRDMKPVPDCWEASYQGSGRLTGRKALVTGGDLGSGGPPRSPFRAKALT